MMALAVVRQTVENVEMRKVQEVTQVLLELDAIQTTHRTSPACGNFRAGCCRERTAQSRDHQCSFRLGQVIRRGRHLPLHNAIVNLNPAILCGVILKVESQRSQVQVTFLGRTVVAANTVPLQECSGWRWKLIGIQHRCGEQQANKE